MLAAGELSGVFVRLFGDADAREVAQRFFFGGFGGQFVDPDGAEGEVVEDGEVREEVELLEDHADFAAQFAGLADGAGEYFAVYADAAFLVGFQVVDAADEGGFARAGRAADDEALALRDVEVDVFQGVEASVPFVEVLYADDDFVGVHRFSGLKYFSRR